LPTLPPVTVHQLLASVRERMAPWSDSEAAFAKIAPIVQMYLGGDGLRPYVCTADSEIVRLMGVQPQELSPPPLIREILGGTYGQFTLTRDDTDLRLYTITVPCSTLLLQRLRLPKVLLIGLGDADRYRGARLPLGVARLAQWLRYTHSAHVTVIDYNLTADPLFAISEYLDEGSYDIIGISVNFGQWQMFQELSNLVNKHDPPIVVLGNILAAFSTVQAAQMFTAASRNALLVATSLGERPLEELCRNHLYPDCWDRIAGLNRLHAAETSPTSRTAHAPEPPELIFPDDNLILQVAGLGGQISLETSFGCNYGACTFCPRSHRGEGWSRANDTVVVAVLERLAPLGAVVSLVDEEFFGSEGLIDPPIADLPAERILSTCRRLGISYEIYTRIEQLFDRRRSREWNIERARLLATEGPSMRRLFVGVESGSPSQLRRYAKGQTVAQIVDALRVAGMLGVPLEFGFITFDPLLTPEELLENILFLARDDVIGAPSPASAITRLALTASYLDGGELTPSGVPLYQRVAYMATELEVLAQSRYAKNLFKNHPHLLDGSYDPGFTRFGVRYADARVGDIAGWCRVWTEGMFTPVYEARMAARASTHRSAGAGPAAYLVARYRDATFTLLTRLSEELAPTIRTRLSHLADRCLPLTGAAPELWLHELAKATLPAGRNVSFDLSLRGHRRVN